MIVDANGCEVVTNNDVSGAIKTSNQSVEFFVTSTAWADVHYVVNGGSQLNVRMTLADARNTYSISNLSAGDQVSYWFTYFDTETNRVIDTETNVYIHSTSQ